MKKSLLILAGIVISVTGAYCLIAYFHIRSKFDRDSITNNLKFDKTTWQTGTARERGQMVNYLLDSIGITGKTKKEIKEITGEPDDEYNCEDGAYKSKFSYSVDRGHVFSYNMIVCFDSAGYAKFVLFDD